MLDEKLVKRVLKIVRDPRVKVAERRYLGGFVRDPAEPFADAEDVRVNGEAWSLEAE